METNGITWVGLDAHKQSIHVAMLLPGRVECMTWQEANEETAVRRLARLLVREAPGEVRSCYEAGPLGYALQRELEAQGIVCEVVAPSLIPRPGTPAQSADPRVTRRRSARPSSGCSRKTERPPVRVAAREETVP